MRTLHVVLPMAGRGSRFANAGYTTPKPLIEVDSMPMFRKALSSLDTIDVEKRYTIIIRKEHEDQYQLSSLLKDALPEVNIVITDDETTGATADALRSAPYLEPDEAVIILDCDLWFNSESYTRMVEASLIDVTAMNGGLLTFPSDDPRYSYAKFGDDGFVVETAEKIVISSHAITGAYFFATSRDFIETSKKLLELPLSPTLKEYYLSPLFNLMIADGGKIQAATVDQYASFGTPEELDAYNARVRDETQS